MTSENREADLNQTYHFRPTRKGYLTAKRELARMVSGGIPILSFVFLAIFATWREIPRAKPQRTQRAYTGLRIIGEEHAWTKTGKH
jgi:hypothetical protein